METADFKNLLWQYTRQINEHTNSVFAPIVSACGLTMLQVQALMELHRAAEPQTVGNLAERINAAGTNISTLCKKLESMGLVKRERDRGDERVVNVALTEKGVQTVKEIDTLMYQRISRHLEQESEETLEEIVKGFESFNRLMQRISTPPEDASARKENSHEF